VDGFADQQTNASGPPAICTFAGNASARLTTAQARDYLADGSIQHVSHVILDLEAFYRLPNPAGATQEEKIGETYAERCQYMFRSNPIPSIGNQDQFTGGGGTAFIANTFQGVGDALANAQAVSTFQGKNRMGHLSGLQRVSRAPDNTPIHTRIDGPGFNNIDVPDGTNQPTLEFSAFVPTADFFRNLRIAAASLDLCAMFKVDDSDNGVERFCTATRRQNFLLPPRAHRSFPLLEMATSSPSVTVPGASPSPSASPGAGQPPPGLVQPPPSTPSARLPASASSVPVHQLSDAPPVPGSASPSAGGALTPTGLNQV
jgi:hypothetical protein